MSLIIDCHGHYTTAPKALEDWRNQQIAGIKDPSVMPQAADLQISDDDLRHSIETNQLKLMIDRSNYVSLFLLLLNLIRVNSLILMNFFIILAIHYHLILLLLNGHFLLSQLLLSLSLDF